MAKRKYNKRMLTAVQVLHRLISDIDKVDDVKKSKRVALRCDLQHTAYLLDRWLRAAVGDEFIEACNDHDKSAWGKKSKRGKK